jgi:hypothetical protein
MEPTVIAVGSDAGEEVEASLCPKVSTLGVKN